MHKRTQDLTNKIIGQWTVLHFAGYNGNKHDAEWYCRCTCGIEKLVKAMNLLSGLSNKCQKCAVLKRANIENELPYYIWKNISYNASKRNIALIATKEECFQLLQKQKYKCALSNLELYISKNFSEHIEKKTTASIDRIDSNKPYIIDNIQWLHKDINMMKHVFEQNYFLYLCSNIVSNNNNYTYNMNTIIETKKQIRRTRTAFSLEQLKQLWIDHFSGMSKVVLAKKYNACRETIYKVISGKTYREESAAVKNIISELKVQKV